MAISCSGKVTTRGTAPANERQIKYFGKSDILTFEVGKKKSQLLAGHSLNNLFKVIKYAEITLRLILQSAFHITYIPLLYSMYSIKVDILHYIL